MTQYVQERVERLEKPIVAWVLLGMIFCLALVYAYYVNGAVSNIVAAKDMRAQISALTSSIGSLEAEYLSLKSTINPEYAKTLGFVESNSQITFVAKTSPKSLSFNR